MSEEDNNNFDDNFDEDFDEEDEDEFSDEDEGAKLYLTLRTIQTWELVRRTWGFPVTSSKDKPRFIIQYDMGRKFSFFVAEFMKAGFEPLSTKKVEYTNYYW